MLGLSKSRKAVCALVAGLVVVGAGCSHAPTYQRPALDVPASHRFADAVRPSTLAQVPAWWRGFGDAELDALVEEALLANHDLKIATARVGEFAARVVGVRAQGLPQVGYAVGAGRTQLSQVTGSSFSGIVSASWELDLWGRIARENEAAVASLLATEEARLGVALTLVAAVVTGYITLLDLDRRLVVAESTVVGRKESVELFELRLEGGVVSDFEISRVRAEYEIARAAIPELRQAIAQQEHALSALAGRNPGPIRRGTTLDGLATPPVPAGLPSDLLERRPDILQSEQLLVAADARVQAARTLYFPSLSLTGTGGRASSELEDLFSAPSRTWSFAGQLLGPIFSAGAIDSANAQAAAQREQALATYERTVQGAFRDVSDALVTLEQRRELSATVERRVAILGRAVELAHERYDNGYADYLDVLDVERNLFSAELSLSAARGDSLRALVDLYRALGGDWTAQPPPLAAAAPTPDDGRPD